MAQKLKIVMLLIVVFTIILCISAFVYAGSQKLYPTKTPHGTFVMKMVSEEDVSYGYLY